MIFRYVFTFLVIMGGGLSACNTQEEQDVTTEPPATLIHHVEFLSKWDNLCGKTLSGKTLFPTDRTHELYRADLKISVDSCDNELIKISFQINAVSDRTWIFTFNDDRNLILQHDHTGIPENQNFYGGLADADGTYNEQRFRADIHTKTQIPEAAQNVWTFSFDESTNRINYRLERNETLRFHAQFDIQQ